MQQPTPDVTRDDVLRIVRRDFQKPHQAAVLEILQQYGGDPSQGEPHRVHLAILKLADKDREAVRKYTTIACEDWRDVLGAAEYPAAMKHILRDYARGERQQIYAQDWEQYEQWLNRE